MKYMILIHTDDAAEQVFGPDPSERDAAHSRVFADLRASGELIDGNELDQDDAAVIGHHGGATLDIHGPFTEGTEIVGGYYIVDVVNRRRAVDVARQLAETRHSPVEIRRMMH